MMRVGSLPLRMRVGSPRWVKVARASGDTLTTRVMTVLSLVGVQSGRGRGGPAGQRWRRRSGRRSWSRCGWSCVVLVTRVSPTLLSRWGSCSEKALRGDMRGLRRSGRATGT